jgi:hypothetical protein
MRKALSALTAATAGLAVMVGLPSAAHAFVPAVLAAIIGGSVLGGAVIGSAVTSSSYPPPEWRVVRPSWKRRRQYRQ